MEGTFPAQRVARRCRRLGLVATAVMAIAIPWWIVSAGAAVPNPGKVTISLHDGTLTTALGAFSPITGSIAGNVDASGNITAPQAGISFTPFTITAMGLDVTITPSATSAWTGTIDPATGHVTLAGDLLTTLAIPLIAVDACPLGPISLHLNSSTAGGVPYNPATGDSTLVDKTFTIPAIPAGQVGCANLEGVINSTLGLPTAPGAVTLSQGALFSLPPPPEAPNAVADVAQTNQNTPVTIHVLANDTPGPAGFPIDPSSLALGITPKHGTAKVNADHTITYTPNAGFSGPDFFTYNVCSVLPTTTTTSTTTTSASTTSTTTTTSPPAAAPCSHAGVTVTVKPTPVTPTSSLPPTSAAPPAAAAAQLPRTGSSSTPLVLLGLGLGTVGLGATSLARTRRRSSAN